VIRRLNGAGSLSRSDSIRNNCSASPKSQITVPQKSELRVAIAVGLRAQSRLPGAEFLDAKRQKSPLKCANACRDQNPRNEWPEIPAEKPYLASCRKRAVCEDWMVEAVGHKLATHHPVIETGLRRRAGNGNLRCRDGHAKADLSPSGDQSRDAQECKKLPFRRNKCEKACGSLSPTTGWWAHQGSNLGPDD
jgi:hypothetical protein